MNLMVQFTVGTLFGVHQTEHHLQKPHIGEQFLRHLPQIKEKAQITDAVRIDLVVQKRRIVHPKLLIAVRSGLFPDILPGKKRNLFQILLPVRLLLIVGKRLRLRHNSGNLLLRHRRLLRRKAGRKSLIPFSCKPSHRTHHHNALMGVFHQKVP